MRTIARKEFKSDLLYVSVLTADRQPESRRGTHESGLVWPKYITTVLLEKPKPNVAAAIVFDNLRDYAGEFVAACRELIDTGAHDAISQRLI